jgi:kynurenine formamidase
VIADTEVDALLRRCNNWGRWGDQDERGTLNLLTPPQRRAAAALISTGELVPLGRAIEVKAAPHSPRPTMHLMTELHADSAPRARGTASDWFGIACHGFATTHLDALCHQSWRGQMYNGRPATDVTARAGSLHGGVEPTTDGVLARGVLLDIPRLRGAAWLEPGEPIEPEELESGLDQIGLTLGAGDVLVVSTGRDARAAANGELEPIREGNPGLSPAAGEWLSGHDPALVVTDVQCDVMTPGVLPHPMPLHVACLVGLGIHLVDNAQLDRLSAACAAADRWYFTFMLTVPRLPRATGAPVNPVAVF